LQCGIETANAKKILQRQLDAVSDQPIGLSGKSLSVSCLSQWWQAAIQNKEEVEQQTKAANFERLHTAQRYSSDSRQQVGMAASQQHLLPNMLWIDIDPRKMHVNMLWIGRNSLPSGRRCLYGPNKRPIEAMPCDMQLPRRLGFLLQ